jgi:hypothetical protein
MAANAATLRPRKAVMEQDENGFNIITERFLKELCEENNQFVTPHLNDTLYLHYKGKIYTPLIIFRFQEDLRFGKIRKPQVHLARVQWYLENLKLGSPHQAENDVSNPFHNIYSLAISIRIKLKRLRASTASPI